MTRWVALLRGVNVNGITVKSAELRALFGRLGLERVRTVLASGNVVFDAADEESPGALKGRIEAALGECFGYDAWIVLLPATRLEAIHAGYPFERRDDDRHPYVVFSSDAAVLAELAARAPGPGDADSDRIRHEGEVLYWELPRASGMDSSFARVSASGRYKPYVTTRNLRTLEKVLAAATG